MFSSISPPKNRSLPTVLLCALTIDFTGGWPPPPSRSLCQRVNLQLQFIKFLVILPFNFQLSLHLERLGDRHCVCVCLCVCVRVHTRTCAQSCLSVTPWTVALQAPLSMGFSRQEHCSGLPCPSPGDLLDSGIESASLVSPALYSVLFSLWNTQSQELNSERDPGLRHPSNLFLLEAMEIQKAYAFPVCLSTLLFP